MKNQTIGKVYLIVFCLLLGSLFFNCSLTPDGGGGQDNGPTGGTGGGAAPTMYTFSAELTTAGSGTGIIKTETPKGSYTPDTTITVEAVANSGSSFLGWFDGADGGTLISGKPLYSFKLIGNRAIYAHFDAGSTRHSFSAQVATDGTGKGSIGHASTANGIYNSGTSITVEAVADEGSYFMGWYDAVTGGNLVPGGETFTFTLTENRALYVRFDLNTYRFSAEKSANGTGTGTVRSATPKGVYDHGTAITVEAIADSGSSFIGWFDAEQGNKMVSTEAKYTFTLTAHKELYARFDAGSTRHSFSAQVATDGTGKGSIGHASTGNGIYNNGTIITVEAVADEGSYFMGWYDAVTGGNKISVDTKYTFTITKTTALYARFDTSASTYSFSAQLATDGKGKGSINSSTSTPNGNYTDGTTITVEAITDSSSTFDGWYDAAAGGNLLYYNSKYTFTLTKNKSIYARFNLKKHTIYVGHTTDCTKKGEIKNLPSNYYIGIPHKRQHVHGSKHTFEAIPDKGYTFKGWYNAEKDGQLLSKSEKYTVTLTKDTQIYAQFLRTKHYFAFYKATDGNGSGDTSGEAIIYESGLIVNSIKNHDFYFEGSVITVEAKADTDNFFLGWFDAKTEGKPVSRDRKYTFTLTKKTNLYAKFGRIEDPVLREAVIKAAGLRPTSQLSYSDISRVTELIQTGYKEPINNINGIEHLTNLNRLALLDNKIRDITLLKKLTNLKSLGLRSNLIEDISPLKELTNITHLNLAENKISNIRALEKMTSMIQIELNNTGITDISPLEKFTNLKIVILADTPLKDLTPLINNSGFGSGDYLYIQNVKPISGQTWKLESRGVNVTEW